MYELKPENLNVGDIFYECFYGSNFVFTVSTKPTKNEFELDDKTRIRWEWSAARSNGDIVNFVITEGLEFYGPQIYSEPQYISFIDGKPEYKIL